MLPHAVNDGISYFNLLEHSKFPKDTPKFQVSWEMFLSKQIPFLYSLRFNKFTNLS